MNQKKMAKLAKMTRSAALRLARWDRAGFGSIRKGKKAALMARKRAAKIAAAPVNFFE